MLTPQERAAYGVISDGLAKNGVAPTIREIMIAMDCSSVGQIHGFVEHLEEKGFIRRLRGRSRAIEIVRLPEDMVPSALTAMEMSRRIAALEAEIVTLRRRLADALPCLPEEIAA